VVSVMSLVRVVLHVVVNARLILKAVLLVGRINLRCIGAVVYKTRSRRL